MVRSHKVILSHVTIACFTFEAVLENGRMEEPVLVSPVNTEGT